jgi:hypothetical protein
VDVGFHDRTTVSLCFRFLFSLPFTLFLPFYFTTKALQASVTLSFPNPQMYSDCVRTAQSTSNVMERGSKQLRNVYPTSSTNQTKDPKSFSAPPTEPQRIAKQSSPNRRKPSNSTTNDPQSPHNDTYNTILLVYNPS